MFFPYVSFGFSTKRTTSLPRVWVFGDIFAAFVKYVREPYRRHGLEDKVGVSTQKLPAVPFVFPSYAWRGPIGTMPTTPEGWLDHVEDVRNQEEDYRRFCVSEITRDYKIQRDEAEARLDEAREERDVALRELEEARRLLKEALSVHRSDFSICTSVEDVLGPWWVKEAVAACE